MIQALKMTNHNRSRRNWAPLVALIFLMSITNAKAAVVSRPLSVELELYAFRHASGDSHTSRARRHDLEKIAKYFQTQNVESIYDISPEKIRDFITTRLASREAASTVARRFWTLRHFFKNCADADQTLSDPTRSVLPPRLSKTQPKWLRADQVSHLRQSADQPRDRFILELMLRGNLRRAEVVELNLENWNLSEMLISEAQRKFNFIHNIPISDSMLSAWQAYAPEREELLLKKEPGYLNFSDALKGRYPLLVSNYKNISGRPESFRLSEKSIYSIVKRINPAIHPRMLRHTAAHDFVTATGDLDLTMEYLGITNVSVARRYTSRTTEEVREALKKIK